MFFIHNNGSVNIGPDELNAMIRSGKEFFLLDVRTRQENQAGAIENSHLIPLQELAHRTHELPLNRDIVVYCRVGNRSAYACAFLAEQGFQVKNLEGGIMSWSMTRRATTTEGRP